MKQKQTTLNFFVKTSKENMENIVPLSTEETSQRNPKKRKLLLDEDNPDSTQKPSPIKPNSSPLNNNISPLPLPSITSHTPIKILPESHVSELLKTPQTEEPLKEPENSMKEPCQKSNKIDFSADKTSEIITQLKDSSKLKPISHKNYHPVNDAIFNKGDPVPFSFLVNGFEEVSKCKGENSKEAQKTILSNIFKSIIQLKPDHLMMTYYLCILKIAPDYVPSELGIGNEIMTKSISKITGRSEKQIRDSLNKIGDLGTVAAESKATQSTISSFFSKKKQETILTIKQVFDSFKKMANCKGNSADKEREGMLMKLLFDSKGEETKYIIRWINKNLKIGVAEATMQASLARAFCGLSGGSDEENFENIIKRCVCEFPNYDKILEGLLIVGKNVEGLLEFCKITPGVPVKPMLAKPTKEIAIIFKRFENMKFTCEFKYDGLRGQIHYFDGQCQVFSRNLMNMTETYPDIIDFVLKNSKGNVRNFILDSEIVAIDKNHRILPFQQLTSRTKKNVDKNDIEINVCLYMFDLIYLNDTSLLQEPLKRRRELIREHFVEVEQKLQFATHLDSDNIEEIQDFLNESVKMGCEGLMVKTLDVNSTYEPAKRSFKWLKLKKDYLDKGLGDTLDLVPIGAFYGTGKRTGFFGSFLLACYNDDMECYETICKIGTGFSEERLEQFHKFLSEHIIKEPLPDYKVNGFQADVWLEPSCVWEIKGADMQISPVYTAGIGDVDPKRGIGLRFPRLVKLREDKKPFEATTSKFIIDIYNSQASVGNIEFHDDEDY